MILKTTLQLLVCISLFPACLFAQSSGFCGHSEVIDAQKANDPWAETRLDMFDARIRQVQYQNPQGMHQLRQGTPPLYTIPVVVHIVHNNGNENISDAQVQNGIDHMNQAFANLGVYDPNTGVDVQVEFCLAQQDTNGAFTTGINRVVSSLTDMTSPNQDLALKNLSRWNPEHYMNIWLVKEITSASAGSGVAGYAYFPTSHGNPEDGIVMEARWMGSSNDNTKIMVHEVGHYLGLYHTFEGGCTNNDCSNQGDKVCDTPPDGSTAPVNCAASPNTCTTDADDTSPNNPFRPVAQGGLGDQPDMFINYMDYGDRVCYSAFTQGQKDRMIAALTTSRSSLLNSLGCSTPCTNPITANFSASATNVQAGTTVNFTNSSTGATSSNWLVNGMPFASTTNSSYTFNAGGTFTVTLQAENGDPSCAEEFSIVITVTCPVSASFTASSSFASLNDTVTFTSTSTGASTYTWWVNGVQQTGTGTTFTYASAVGGGYTVQLLASNGTCTDSSAFFFVNVGGCGMERFRIWYFGRGAGLDFNTSPPTALTNNAFRTEEGSATMCDKSGNLLFYADTDTVFTRNHVRMPNGTGLSSQSSSSQGTILAPMPGDTSKYYVFNVSQVFNQNPGLRYSVVDMTLNGGFGDIIPGQKNILMGTNMVEKQVAIRHANGLDFWVLTVDYTDTTFKAFLVDCNGPSNVPVVSSPGGMGPQNGQGLGTLNVSPDGKHVMLCNLSRHAGLYDFDNATGIISNPIVFTTDPGQSAEFSPDNSKLYYFDRLNWPWKLMQHDITSGNPTTILNNGIVIQSGTNGIGAAMQLAADGKIYIVNNLNGMSVIENPNAAGAACGFQYNTVSLTAYPGSSLPDFLWDAPSEIPPTISGPATICANAGPFTYGVTFPSCHQDSVIWSVIGNGSIASSSNTGATLMTGGSGSLQLIVERRSSCGNSADTLDIVVNNGPEPDLGADVLACAPAGQVLDAGPGYSSYLWQNGSTNQTLQVTGPGLYWVEVTNSIGCTGRDSVQINQFNPPAPQVNLGPDQVLCGSQTFVLDAGPGFFSYQWHDLSTAQTFTGWLAGTYWVTVSNACGVTDTDTIEVSFDNNPLFSLGPDTTVCPGEPILLTAPSGFVSYFWSDSSTATTFLANGPGTYWVEVFDANGCYHRDSIVVDYCNGRGTAIPKDIQVYPNPAQDRLFIQLGGSFTAEEISIFDPLGKRIKINTNLVSNTGLIELSTGQWARGVYFLMIRSGEQMYSHKILLE